MSVGTDRYPTYRSGRHPWIADVPEHWVEHRAKVTFREVDERSEDGREELLSVSHMTGVTPRSQKNVTMFKAESYAGHKLCRPRDVVINTMWAWMGALGESQHTGIVSPAYGVYRPHQKDAFAPGYLDYLLRTQTYVAEYICRSTGIRSSRLRLYPDKFLCIPLLQPPIDEQHKIVSYLRAQDRQIAKLIRGKRRLIELLNEQKQTIIHRGVTRGLNPDVPLKPSGTNELGQLPNGWECRRLRTLVREPITNGVGVSARGFEPSWPRYVRITDIGGPTVLKDSGEASLPPDVAEKAPLRKGDLLFAAVGATVGKSYLHLAEGSFCYAGFLVRVAPKQEVRGKFLLYWAQSHLFWDQIRRGVIKATIENFSASRYKNLVVFVPKPDEQKAIVDFLDGETSRFDEAIHSVEDSIRAILEWRDRLVADVVTGQVDVRSWKPSAEETVDEGTAQVFADVDEGEEAEEENGADEHE